MYEMLTIGDSQLLNLDINRDLYTDESIGEYPPIMETLIFENEIYRISFSPLDNKDEILCYRIYKKDTEVYHVCRISFFEDKYIESKMNTFRLNEFELYLFNQILSSYGNMTKAIESYNLEMQKVLAFGDFDNIKEIWKPINFDIVRQSYLLPI